MEDSSQGPIHLKRKVEIHTEAGFMHPPVKSAPKMLRVSLDMLEIHVFLTKLPGKLLVRNKEMKTIVNVRSPSVNAP